MDLYRILNLHLRDSRRRGGVSAYVRWIDAPAAAATVGDSVDGGTRCNFAAMKHFVERVNGTPVTLYNKVLLVVFRTVHAGRTSIDVRGVALFAWEIFVAIHRG